MSNEMVPQQANPSLSVTALINEGLPENFDPSKAEWEVAIEEAGEPIEFKEVGDSFVGVFTGMRTVEMIDTKGEVDNFTILTFKGKGGVAYQTNAGWKLEAGFKDADIMRGDIVYVQYVKDVDTGQPSPMKDFKVFKVVKHAAESGTA
jgi:hypothetical protein